MANRSVSSTSPTRMVMWIPQWKVSRHVYELWRRYSFIQHNIFEDVESHPPGEFKKGYIKTHSSGVGEYCTFRGQALTSSAD